MNGWIVLLIVLAVLFLLAQVRLGAGVEYAREGLRVWLRVGPKRITVFPAGEKKKKPPRHEKPPKEKKPEEGKPKGGLVDLVVELLPPVLDTVRRFFRKLQVDTLEMELTAASPDPADAAMLYGQASALLASLWRPMVEVLHVKDGRAHVGVDFDAEAMTIYIKAALSLTVGQTLALGAVFGGKALAAFVRFRRRRKEKEQKGRSAPKEREAA